MIKAPVWTREAPWYMFAGGLTGASAALSVAAEANGNEVLARRAWLVTLAGGTASPALLISELGRPERFLNMMRVLKPTSPMSVGSWVLAAAGTAAGLATAQGLGVLPGDGRAARAAVALFGLPLATYTAAVISNTAVPVWHEARRELPFVFAGSAAASAGAAAAIVTPARHAKPARRLAVAGAVLESAAVGAMERRLGPLAEPYRHGRARLYTTAARALTISGATVMTRGATRAASVAAGGMLLAGAVLERWSVFEAGFESARNPAYTVGPQRRRVDGN